MNIKEFFSTYHTAPILFVGTGMSLRYLNGSLSWKQLLESIMVKAKEPEKTYLDFTKECFKEGEIDNPMLGELISKVVEEKSSMLAQQDIFWKDVENTYYSRLREQKIENLSKLKIVISKIFSECTVREEMKEEIEALKDASEKVACVITTNYDTFIEDNLDFVSRIGNNILLSNPFKSVYKIHGCVSDSNQIIIGSSDYDRFDKKYDLIRARLISLFCYHPIIFLGYSLQDDNIKKVLKTIFNYVQYGTELADRVKRNFLLVEYEKGSTNLEISEHTIDCGGGTSISIHKLKTDLFRNVYDELATLNIRSVQELKIVYQETDKIYAGKSVNLDIAGDFTQLSDAKRGIVFGNRDKLKYVVQTSNTMINNYFEYVAAGDVELVKTIDKLIIQNNQYFPAFGYCSIYPDLGRGEELKNQQINKLKNLLRKKLGVNEHVKISDILQDETIRDSYKIHAILYAVSRNHIDLNELEDFIKDQKDLNSTMRALICMYDLKRYGGDRSQEIA